jgi:hypothetical protein
MRRVRFCWRDPAGGILVQEVDDEANQQGRQARATIATTPESGGKLSGVLFLNFGRRADRRHQYAMPAMRAAIARET